LFTASVVVTGTIALLTLAMTSCASEENDGLRNGTAGSGATGGVGGTGPTTGGGGGTGGATGGATGGGSGTGTGTCPGPATIDPSAFPPCALCDGAHCVPSSAVPPDFADQLQDCPDVAGSKCVPDDLIATAGQFLFKTCTSLLNAEGRCVPTCIQQVASQQDRLPVDVCQPDERCAPCFDPTSGQSTGACNAGCDTGPANPTPVTFAKCCGDLGSCVPKDLVPADLQNSLSQDACTDPTTLCAPNTFTGTTGTGPTVCQSLLVQDGKHAEGRCVPTCVPQVQEQADQLPQDICATGEKCAPCTNPIDGTSTGSCTVGSDQPTEPPLAFADCCSNHGKCVPKALAGSQGANLDAQECQGADFVCAPTEKVNDLNHKFPACDTVLFGPGACIFACFAGANGPILQPGTCTGGTVCAPCTNPLDGTTTGACS
jgi:hypothetical protein